MRKKLLLCLLLVFVSISGYAAFFESWDATRQRRLDLAIELSACKNYIIAAAELERNALGKISRIIQDGLDLLETKNPKLSDLKGIVTAHKQIIELKRTLQTQQAKSQVISESKQQHASVEEIIFAREAQAKFGGELEVRLQEGSRVDLLTETHAFEVEKSEKWKEVIGHALHYALLTDRQAGIVLIMDKPSSHKHLERLRAVIAEYRLPIEVFITE